MTLLKSFEELDYSQALESSTEAQKWLEKHGRRFGQFINGKSVSYTHLRAHETDSYLVCRLML